MASNPVPFRAKHPDRPSSKTVYPVKLETASSSNDVKALVAVDEVYIDHPTPGGKAFRKGFRLQSWGMTRKRRGKSYAKASTGEGTDVALIPLNLSGKRQLQKVITALRISSSDKLVVKGYRQQAPAAPVRPDQGSPTRGRTGEPAAQPEIGQAEIGQPAIGGVLSPDAFKPSAKARASLRGLRIIEEDLKKAEGTFDLEDSRSALMGISRQAIHDKVQKDQMMAVPGPGGVRRYPAFQFHNGRVLPGLDKVLAALPSRDPWFRLHWLVNPDDRLSGKTPADLLRAGEIGLVVEAALRYGEMGA